MGSASRINGKMAALRAKLSILTRNSCFTALNHKNIHISRYVFSEENNSNISVEEADHSSDALSRMSSQNTGLKHALEMFDKVDRSLEDTHHFSPSDESFATMLRRSKLMQIGDPDGRIVVGG